MLNKDRTLDRSQGMVPVKFDTITRFEGNPKDIQLIDDLLAEVNEQGYYVQYYWFLKEMELCDRCVYPIIKKYIGKFEHEIYSVELISALGVPKMYEATEYLLDLYRNDRLREYRSTSPCSIRWAAANALFRIKDPNFQEEYRELIKTPGMSDGAWLLIGLLGKFKTQKNYDFLMEIAQDESNVYCNFAIKALGGFKDQAEEMIPLLEKYAKNDDYNIRHCAMGTLKKMEKYIVK